MAKIALITGATSGIGEACAKIFAREHYDLILTGRRLDRLEKLAGKLNSEFNVQVAVSSFDVRNRESVVLSLNNLPEKWKKVTVLVNNAGVTRDNLILRMSEQQWDEVINANLKSVFNLTKHVSKVMLRNKRGSIINLTSIVGVNGQAGQSNYSASKAGIIGFTKSIADEFGSRSIRCNAIAPGFIETDMTMVLPEETKKGILAQIPMKRMGQAEEVANVALFLASELSTYVSGQVISVCGAMSR